MSDASRAGSFASSREAVGASPARISSEEAWIHEVLNGSCTIEVRTLDVELEPETLLEEVEALAREIAASAAMSEAAQPAQPRCSPSGPSFDQPVVVDM